MAGRKKTSKTRSKKMAYLRGKLLEKRRELLHALDRGERARTSGPASIRGDEYDAANGSSDMETLCSIAELETSRLSEVERALEKIEAGTYGQCERCGAKIPAGRLKVMPFAALCLNCQEEEERMGGSQNGALDSAWSRVDFSFSDVDAADSVKDPIRHE